jgi:acyl carrier protein
VEKPSTGNELDALAALQAAYDEVLPEAKRELQLSDELLELGIGSIAALEIAAALQVSQGVEIPDSDLFELRTVGDFAALVLRRKPGA